VIELRQQGSAGPVGNYTRTLWLDTDWYYPLQRRAAWTQGGIRRVVRTTYTNVSFNPAFDDTTFTFDPPANASVETAETPEQRRYESVSALRAAAEMAVPDPSVPDDLLLAEATRTTGQITSVGLRYVNATSVVTVTKLGTVYPTSSEGQEITVGGHDATYRNLGPEQSVVWTCEGAQYKVQGRGVHRSVLFEVAASVDCA
jgi:hypothetical protein